MTKRKTSRSNKKANPHPAIREIDPVDVCRRAEAIHLAVEFHRSMGGKPGDVVTTAAAFESFLAGKAPEPDAGGGFATVGTPDL